MSVTHEEPDPGSAEPIHVGKYRIVRRFSEVSGQAAAYLAFDPDLERHVVLKRYHGPSGEAEEGRALAKVVSPYVARCHGIERIDGEAYLVVEYVPGPQPGRGPARRAPGHSRRSSASSRSSPRVSPPCTPAA